MEEQFYLFWPLILVLVLTVWGKSRRALLVGVLVGIVVSTLEMAILYHPYTDPSRVYYGTDTRVATLLLGAALAFVWAPWRLVGRTGRNAAVLLDLAALVEWLRPLLDVPQRQLLRSEPLPRRVPPRRVRVGRAHRARRCTPRRGSVPRLLAIAVFRWIGVRSYGIYLWHWPIYMVTRPHSDVPLTGIPLLVLRLALTLVAAALSYRFVEEPIRHGALERWWARFRTSSGETRRKLATRFGLAASGITLGLVVIVVGLGDGGSAAAPAGLGDKTSVVIRPGQTTTTTAAPGATTPTTVPATTAPPVTTLPPTTVTAIGDSVMLGAANQLAATVNAMFGNQPVTGVDAAESRQFSAGVDLIQQLQGRRPARARTSSSSSAPTAPSTRVTSTA